LLVPIELLTLISLLATSAVFLSFIDWLTANLHWRKTVIIMSLTCVIEAGILALILFYYVAFSHDTSYIVYNFNWIDTGLFTVSFSLLLDSLTVIMLIN